MSKPKKKIFQNHNRVKRENILSTGALCGCSVGCDCGDLLASSLYESAFSDSAASPVGDCVLSSLGDCVLCCLGLCLHSMSLLSGVLKESLSSLSKDMDLSRLGMDTATQQHMPQQHINTDSNNVCLTNC